VSVPAELRQMLDALRAAAPIHQPSRFWEELSASHLAILSSADGYAHFKRSLNNQYFQFGLTASRFPLLSLGLRWLRHPDGRVLRARFDGATTRIPKAIDRLLLPVPLALYASAVLRLRHGDVLATIPEPAVGDPVVIRFGDLRLTEDLCHSVEERASILEGLAGRPLRSVLELGAGYGRLAYVLLRAGPGTRYTIVDIPPALYVSQRYLTDVLPDRKVFRFRPFADHAAVAEEMAAADLVFLEPQQLELLPDRSFDLGATVSTLHEMRPDQISHYIQQLDRLCDAVYTKQWRRFHNQRDGVVITASDYPIPERWRPVFHRSPMFPRTFFESLYLVR
jgi:SAM-dependent methyltransferase